MNTADAARKLGLRVSVATTFAAVMAAAGWILTTKARSFRGLSSPPTTSCQRPKSGPSSKEGRRTMDDASIIGPEGEQWARDAWVSNGGLSGFQPERAYWCRTHLLDIEGDVAADHIYQVDQFVHYLDRSGGCVCGPHVVVMQSWTGKDFVQVTHNEWNEFDEDGEPVDIPITE